MEEDEDATTGVTEGKTQNRKNRKKGRVPRPPREVDSDDDGDEDDMFKIDPHALDRRNLTKEVSKQPPPTRSIFMYILSRLLTRFILLFIPEGTAGKGPAESNGTEREPIAK